MTYVVLVNTVFTKETRGNATTPGKNGFLMGTVNAVYSCEIQAKCLVMKLEENPENGETLKIQLGEWDYAPEIGSSFKRTIY